MVAVVGRGGVAVVGRGVGGGGGGGGGGRGVSGGGGGEGVSGGGGGGGGGREMGLFHMDAGSTLGPGPVSKLCVLCLVTGSRLLHPASIPWSARPTPNVMVT